MDESRDPSRIARIDWAGAALAVLGFGALVFALLEWQSDLSTVLKVTMVTGGLAALAAFVTVEGRAESPMMPLGLFTSRTFSLANLLTLLLYGPLSVMLWLFPLELIQVLGYSPTAAGAALLPFPVLMFVLSRWSGGLVSRVGSRLPLTIGPLVAAAGLALLGVARGSGSYWATFFPAVIVLALGMAMVVAPLTTTVMAAVDTQHAGVASGINNAVARVAGLLAIAVFGLLLTRAFDAKVNAALAPLDLASAQRARVDRELPKLAGADVSRLGDPATDAIVRRAIDDAFTSSVRTVMLSAAGMASLAGYAGRRIRA